MTIEKLKLQQSHSVHTQGVEIALHGMTSILASAGDTMFPRKKEATIAE